MAEIVKPDLTNLWASGGAVIAPSTSKIQTGWTAEIPPHQWENYVQNRQDKALGYLFQRGIPEWDSITEYWSGKSFVQYNGKTYKAIANTLNVVPTSDVTKWQIWGLGVGDLPDTSQTQKGVIQQATEGQAKALSDMSLGISPGTLGAVLTAYGLDLPKIKTYAEAIALTEDIGPIIVVGMDGVWEWSTSAYFTGYRHPRCGHWEDGWTPTPLAFQIEAHGGVWSEADPKEKRVIARFRESGLITPIGSWIAGEGKIADMGGGNWRGVDYRNMHKRAAGVDADTANARALGIKQLDALKAHTHAAQITIAGWGSLSGSRITAAGGADGGYPTTFAASTGGAESRSVNTAVCPYIHI